MAYGADGAENFEISNVISRAFGAIGANFLLYLALSLILTGIPTFGLAWWERLTQAQMLADPANNPVFTASYWIMIGATLVVSIVTGAVLQAALTRATVANLAGERPTFGSTLAAGIGMMPATVAIGLLTTLALSLVLTVIIVPVAVLFGLAMRDGGAALLPLLMLALLLVAVIPVILLWIRWSVAVPAYVQERIGVFASFGRSNRLTKGARLKIFLTVLVILVATYALQLFIDLFAGLAAVAGGAVLTAAVTCIAAAFSGMISSTIYASIYVELRDVKEGVEPDALEAIFA